MITPKEADLFEVLAELRQRYPAWRFGQLIANVAGWADKDVWDVEDDDLLETARSHLEAATNREQKVSA